MQPDRKILVAGNALGSATMTVTRLKTNGTPDTTFDGDGTATVDFGSLADGCNDALLQPDGKIVLVGFTQAVDSPPGGRAPERQRLAGHDVRHQRQGDFFFIFLFFKFIFFFFNNLLIHQGTTPTPGHAEWDALSEEQARSTPPTRRSTRRRASRPACR